MTPPRFLAWVMVSLCATASFGAEATTEWEGAPAITHVKLLRNDHGLDWWAWVTLEHEDWPIESRRFPLPEKIECPPLSDDPWWEHHYERRHLRLRRLTHPYTHFVNWWVVTDPDGNVIHKRYVEQPHPGGWPWVMLDRGIKIPRGVTKITFKAHDKIHGVGPRGVTVDLLQKKGPGFEIEVLGLPPYTGRHGAARRFFRSVAVKDVRDTNW